MAFKKKLIFLLLVWMATLPIIVFLTRYFPSNLYIFKYTASLMLYGLIYILLTLFFFAMLAVTKKRNVSDIVVLAVYCFFSANLVANNVFRANQIYAFESLIGPLPFVKYYMFGIPFEGMVGKKNYALILHKCHITDKNQEGGISYIHNKKTYVLCPQIYGRFNYHANIVTCYL